MFCYVLFALMIAYVSAQQTPYDKCPSPQPDSISSFYIAGCTTSPCHFKKGNTIVANFKFTPPYDSTSAPLKYKATIAGTVATGATPANAGDVCKYMTPSCPLKMGNSYSTQYYISSNLPLGCGTIENWIDNPQGQRIYCQILNVCIDP